jgi:transcriptional antiterminator
MYSISRVLNNNVVLVRPVSKKKEMILVGKGIGFGLKKGAVVDIPDEKIENSYLAYDEKKKGEYYNIINQIDDEVIGVCAEIVMLAESRLGGLNKEAIITITDHISFALERIKGGMEIQNPFLHEIKSMCPEEYKLALEIQEIIDQRLGIFINDDEVGFITFHLCESRLNRPVTNAVKQARLLKKLITFIEERLGIKINEGLTYNRLVNHFKGSIERATQGIETVNPLLENIKSECSTYYKIAEEINVLIQGELGVEISEAEIGYLALHINRLDRISKN